jgi:hypothetical protein
MSTESQALDSAPIAEAAPQDALTMLQSQMDAEAQSEEAAEPEAAEKTKEDFLAPKFAALTRKEKQIKAYETQVKAKEAELTKRLAELEGKSTESEGKLKSFETGLKDNALKMLKERGITLEQLIEMQMNDENPTVDMKLKRFQEEMEAKAMSRVEELEKKLRDKEENEAKSQYEKAVEGYKSELGNFVSQNAETYELIAANGATDLMFQVAEEYFQSTKKVPDIKEVADAVEAHLEAEARKIFELKKFKQASQKPQPSQQKTAPTLSNTSAANVPSNGAKKLTNEESLREAAKLIRWDE